MISLFLLIVVVRLLLKWRDHYRIGIESVGNLKR
jgi:hypothetical protein